MAGPDSDPQCHGVLRRVRCRAGHATRRAELYRLPLHGRIHLPLLPDHGSDRCPVHQRPIGIGTGTAVPARGFADRDVAHPVAKRRVLDARVLGHRVSTEDRATVDWLYLVPILILQSVFSLGLALSSPVGAQLPDFKQLMPYLMRTWRYGSVSSTVRRYSQITCRRLRQHRRGESAAGLHRTGPARTPAIGAALVSTGAALDLSRRLGSGDLRGRVRLLLARRTGVRPWLSRSASRACRWRANLHPHSNCGRRTIFTSSTE